MRRPNALRLPTALRLTPKTTVPPLQPRPAAMFTPPRAVLRNHSLGEVRSSCASQRIQYSRAASACPTAGFRVNRGRRQCLRRRGLFCAITQWASRAARAFPTSGDRLSQRVTGGQIAERRKRCCWSHLAWMNWRIYGIRVTGELRYRKGKSLGCEIACRRPACRVAFAGGSLLRGGFGLAEREEDRRRITGEGANRVVPAGIRLRGGKRLLPADIVLASRLCRFGWNLQDKYEARW